MFWRWFQIFGIQGDAFLTAFQNFQNHKTSAGSRIRRRGRKNVRKAGHMNSHWCFAQNSFFNISDLDAAFANRPMFFFIGTGQKSIRNLQIFRMFRKFSQIRTKIFKIAIQLRFQQQNFQNRDSTSNYLPTKFDRICKYSAILSAGNRNRWSA